MRVAISGNERLNALDPAFFFLLALAAGFGAAWLLGPGAADFPFTPADPARLFDREELGYWSEYRERVRLIAIGGVAAELLVLGWLAFHRGRWLERVLGGLSGRPVAGALVVGVGLAVVIGFVGLPFSLLGWATGVDYGLITNPFTGWLLDRLLALLVSVVVAAPVAVLVLLAWRRLGRSFWLVLWVLAVSLALATAWLWPVVVSPLFNRFEPVEDGPLRTEVERLADETGTSFGGLYTVDSSRRSNAINAYVTGVGSSRRVVVYDRVPERLERAELEILVAHELAHVESQDVIRAIAFVLLVAPFGAFAVQRATSRLLRRRGFGEVDAGVLLPIAFFTTLVVLMLSVPGAWLSRQVEIQADQRALELTGRPGAAISLQKRLTRENLGDPDPPGLHHAVFGTHPSAVERVGLAEAWAKRGGEGKP